MSKPKKHFSGSATCGRLGWKTSNPLEVTCVMCARHLLRDVRIPLVRAHVLRIIEEIAPPGGGK